MNIPSKYQKLILLGIICVAIFVLVRSVSLTKKQLAEPIIANEVPQVTVSPAEAAYKADPLSSENVHAYTLELNTSDQYDKAYKVLSEYFATTPRSQYQEDISLWLDLAMAELKTHHCAKAAASAYHVTMRTEEGSQANDLATSIFQEASNDTACIEI